MAGGLPRTGGGGGGGGIPRGGGGIPRGGGGGAPQGGGGGIPGVTLRPSRPIPVPVHHGGGFVHDIGSFFGAVGHDFGQAAADVHGIASGIYPFAKDFWNTITNPSNYDITASPFGGTTRSNPLGHRDVPAQYHQTVGVFEHPLRDPFMTFITLMPFLGLAGKIADLGMAGRLAEADRSLLRPGPGAEPVYLHASHNLGMKALQLARDWPVQWAMNERPGSLLARYGYVRQGVALRNLRFSRQLRDAIAIDLRHSTREVVNEMRKAGEKMSRPEAKATAMIALRNTSEDGTPEERAMMHQAFAQQNIADGLNPERNLMMARLYQRVHDLGITKLDENGHNIIDAAKFPKLAETDAKILAHSTTMDQLLVRYGFMTADRQRIRIARPNEAYAAGRPIEPLVKSKNWRDAELRVSRLTKVVAGLQDKEEAWLRGEGQKTVGGYRVAPGPQMTLGGVHVPELEALREHSPYRDRIVTKSQQLEEAQAQVRSYEIAHGLIPAELPAARQNLFEAIQAQHGEAAAQEYIQFLDQVAKAEAVRTGGSMNDFYNERIRNLVTGGDHLIPEAALAELDAFHNFSEADVAKRLKSKLAGQEKGAGLQENARMFSSKGHVVVGPITVPEWLNRVISVMPDAAERDAWARWYETFEPAFRQAFGKNAEKLMRGFALSQANRSPAIGLLVAMRVLDDINHGLPVSKEAFQAIESAIRKLPIKKGIAAKLSDFIDSLRQQNTRTWMGGSPLGGRPAAGDVHAARDVGYVDKKVLRKLAKQHGLNVDELLKSGELKIDNPSGSPSGNRYERISEFYNQAADHLNAIGFDGRTDWTPAQAQAMGWAAIQKFHGVEPEDFTEALRVNTRTLAAEGVGRRDLRALIRAEGGHTIRTGVGWAETLTTPEQAARIGQRLADQHGESRVMWLSNKSKARTPLLRIVGRVSQTAERQLFDAGFTHRYSAGRDETMFRADRLTPTQRKTVVRIIKEHNLEVKFNGKVQEDVYTGRPAAVGRADYGGAMGRFGRAVRTPAEEAAARGAVERAGGAAGGGPGYAGEPTGPGRLGEVLHEPGHEIGQESARAGTGDGAWLGGRERTWLSVGRGGRRGLVRFTELDGSRPEELARFEQARQQNPRVENLTAHTPEQLAASRVFLSEDGKTGFMISPDGELQNLFRNPGGVKGSGADAIDLARSLGATHLENYDTRLTDIYRRHGFGVVSRIPWDDSQAPANWNYAELGRPDVVFMAHGAQDLGREAPYASDYGTAQATARAAGRTLHELGGPFPRGGYDPATGTMYFTPESTVETYWHEAFHAIRQGLSEYQQRVLLRHYGSTVWDRPTEEAFTRDMLAVRAGDRVAPVVLRAYRSLTGTEAGRNFVSYQLSRAPKVPAAAGTSARMSNIIKGQASPVISQEMTGAGILSGKVPEDTIQSLADGYNRVLRAVNTAEQRNAWARAGSKLWQSRYDILVREPDQGPSGPSTKIPADMQQVLDQRQSTLADLPGTLAEHEAGFIEGVRAWLEDKVPGLNNPEWRRYEQSLAEQQANAPEGFVWVDRRVVGNLGRFTRQPMEGLLGAAIRRLDDVNLAVTAATVYLKLGHIPTRLLTNAATNIIQGSARPDHLRHAIQMWRALSGADRQRAISLTGTAYYQSLPQGGATFARTIAHGGANVYARYADSIFRFNSIVYEAAKEGITTPEAFTHFLDVLSDPERYHVSGLQLHRLQEIADRADRGAIAYDNLSDIERTYITRVIWFYPWLKGSLVFAKETMIEHPYKSALMGNWGAIQARKQQQLLGMLPSYERGLFEVGPPNVHGMPLVSDFSTFSPFSTAADVLNIPTGLEPVSGYFNPMMASLAGLLQNTNQYGAPIRNPNVGKEIMNYFQQMIAPTPEYQIYSGWQHPADQSHRMFPASWQGALYRYLFGPAFPRRLNLPAARADWARQLKGG